VWKREGGVKKVGMVVFGVSVALFSALPAFAQSDIPPEVGGEVVAPPVIEPPGSGEGASTAFTGANVTVWMLIVVALLVVGTALLLAGRRRARSARA
jgi:hypothetical protein